jgi:uncharacterized protein
MSAVPGRLAAGLSWEETDPWAKDRDGKTALHYARAHGDSSIVEMLIKAGRRSETMKMRARQTWFLMIAAGARLKPRLSASASEPGGVRCGMKPRISLITLTVDDLDRSLKFYRDGLGFATKGIVGTEFEHGTVVFFDLEGGLKMALWPRASLSHDSGLPNVARSSTLGHNVRSREQVDAVMQQAQKAGAVIVKPAQKTFWGGYAGYFQDPDGHLWEIAWNPQMLPRD